MSIVLFVAFVLGVIAVFGGGLFFVIVTLLMRASGWNRLTEHFSYSGPPPSSCRKRQTVRIGSTRFRNSMTLGPTPQGLYLHTRFSRQDLLIPWAAFTTVTQGTVYWRSANIIHIGNPEIGSITLFDEQYRWVQSFTKN